MRALTHTHTHTHRERERERESNLRPICNSHFIITLLQAINVILGLLSVVGNSSIKLDGDGRPPSSGQINYGKNQNYTQISAHSVNIIV